MQIHRSLEALVARSAGSDRGAVAAFPTCNAHGMDPGVKRLGVHALVLISLLGCSKHATEAPAPAAAREHGVDVHLSPTALEAARLSFAPVRSSPRRSTLVAMGLIDFVPRKVARVGPLVDGRISTVLVEPGQRVQAGAVLATIQSFEVGKTRAELAAAGTRVRLADAEIERQRRMADAGATTDREVATALAAREIAAIEARAANDRLRAVGAGVRDPVQSGGQSTAAGIALTTPVAGAVREVNARVGQAVGATDTLFVVGDTDEVWLVLDVYERDLGRVSLGNEVRISVPAFPDRTFDGQVSFVGNVVDPERKAVDVRVVLPNPDGLLRPGMTATARILGAPVGGTNGHDAGTVIAVPREAVQTIDGLPHVFVDLGEGKFSARPFMRGADLDGEVEVVSGLRGDERVVTHGSFILKSELLREEMGKND